MQQRAADLTRRLLVILMNKQATINILQNGPEFSVDLAGGKRFQGEDRQVFIGPFTDGIPVLAKELATKDKDELIRLLAMFSPETSVWAEVILRGNAAINVQTAGSSQKVVGTAVGLWLTRSPTSLRSWRDGGPTRMY